MYPGISAFFFKDQKISDPIRIKDGETTVTVQSGKTQRWGDYTGLQIRYNEKGVVWGSGYFGLRKGTMERVNGSYITQLKSPTFASLESPFQINKEIKAFPNPVVDFLHIEFISAETQVCEFRILDNQGRELKLLQKTLVRAGKNRMNLNLSPLNPGIYFLRVVEENGKNHSYKLFSK